MKNSKICYFINLFLNKIITKPYHLIISNLNVGQRTIITGDGEWLPRA